ncbi:hypothetical protein L6Q79_10575 [bacterium]|nr:hypothetical protein [bacterium]NUN45977.1 hypothetical protein [bacterium]
MKNNIVLLLLIVLACNSEEHEKKPKIISFIANPDSITSGQSTMLSWDVSGAETIFIDNNIGIVSGTLKTVTPAFTTIYKLKASNKAGIDSAITTVIVNSNPTNYIGIAQKYPGDLKIEEDADVIFTEMFEEATISNMMTYWNQKTTVSSNIVFDKSVPSGSLGSQSLQLKTIDDGTNANENTFIYKQLNPDITDSIFVRYYIKYDNTTAYHHSGVYVGGKNPPSPTAGQKSGVKPLGNVEFHVGTEITGAARQNPADYSKFGFYNYWMGMHPYTTGPNAGSYYGNEFINNSTANNISLTSWHCIEMMIKLNSPVSASNGELKLWVDGVQIFHLGYMFPVGTWSEAFFTEGSGIPFEGFQWRNDPALNLNYIWLKNFNDNNNANHIGSIFFDHLVIAKKYIGPISK